MLDFCYRTAYWYPKVAVGDFTVPNANFHALVFAAGEKYFVKGLADLAADKVRHKIACIVVIKTDEIRSSKQRRRAPPKISSPQPSPLSTPRFPTLTRISAKPSSISYSRGPRHPSAVRTSPSTSSSRPCHPLAVTSHADSRRRACQPRQPRSQETATSVPRTTATSISRQTSPRAPSIPTAVPPLIARCSGMSSGQRLRTVMQSGDRSSSPIS